MHNRNAKMHNSSIIQSYSIISGSTNTFQHLTCSSLFIWHQYNCRDGIIKVTYLLMKNSSRNQLRRCNVPPTIGRRSHQSLRNTATPELGMIPQGIRVNLGLHIAKGHNQQANTAGFIRPSTNRPSQHSPKTNHCIPQQNNPFAALWRRQRQLGDTPKQTMSIAEAHKATQSCSWP